jgi:hypothetical protein
MRWIRQGSTLLAALLALVVFAPSAGQAAEQKWCAQYGPDGGRNCGFATFEQCQTTVSGVGGFCEQNPFYTGSDKQPAPRRKKRSN